MDERYVACMMMWGCTASKEALQTPITGGPWNPVGEEGKVAAQGPLTSQRGRFATDAHTKP